MAGTAVTVTPEFSTSPESVVEQLRLALNRAVDDLETLRVRVHAISLKLDADGTVTDTDYAAGTYSSSVAVPTAAAMTAQKVNHRS